MKIFQHKAYENKRNKVITLLIDNNWFVSTLDVEDNVISKKPHHYALNLNILEKLMGKTKEKKLSELIEKVSIACDELNVIDENNNVKFMELIKHKDVEDEQGQEQILSEEITSHSKNQENIFSKPISVPISVPKSEPEPVEDTIEYTNVEETHEPKEKTVEESDYTELDDSEFVESKKLSSPDSYIGTEEVTPMFGEVKLESKDELKEILDNDSDETKIPNKNELTKIIKEVEKRKPGRPKKNVNE